ncbi:MAG: hypothetical protein HRU21_10850 [Pseudomonadales bacterium]|nr:hypothetical protein [Pseudomonadales bacterium]
MNVSEEIHSQVIHRLEGYGSEPSPNHSKALRLIAETIENTLLAPTTNRIAAPLFAGGGKSLTVRATVVQVLKLNKTMLIAVSNCEEADALYKDLAKDGVDMTRVGLFYTQKTTTDEVELIRRSEMVEVEVLIITQQLVQKAEPTEYTFKGEPRSLVVWDEQFISTSARFTTLSKIQSQFRTVLQHDFEGKSSEAARELRSWIEAAQREFDKLTGGKEDTVRLPETTYQASYKGVFKQVGIEHQPITQVIAWAESHSPIRLIRVDGSNTLVADSRVLIPDSLQNVLVLDATADVSALVSADSSLEVLTDMPIKRYDNVTVKLADVPSGRGKMNELKSKYVAEVKHILREEIPEDEEVLICTLKDSNKSKIYARLKNALDGDSRVRFLTWGKHRGINTFAHVPNLIIVGTMYRNEAEVTASYAAATRKPMPAISREQQFGWTLDEASSDVVQLLNRIACRNTINDQAGKATVWAFAAAHQDTHNMMMDLDRPYRSLPDHLPGLVVEERTPAVLPTTAQMSGMKTRSNKAGRVAALKEKMVGELSRLPEDVNSYSKGDLIQAALGDSYNARQANVKRALDSINKDSDTGWYITSPTSNYFIRQ